MYQTPSLLITHLIWRSLTLEDAMAWELWATAAVLSCTQWKAHHEFHVPHVIIEYLQLQQNNPSRIDDILTLNNIVILQHSMFFLVTN